MATSGTATIEFDILDIIEEAFERCGLEARTGYDIRTARRSLNLIAQEWGNKGINLWTVEEGSIPLVAGDNLYDLPADTIDVMEVKVRTGTGSSQLDTNLSRISFATWANVAQKNLTGQPTQYYVDRGTTTSTIRLWPVPTAADTLVFWYIRRMQDVTGMTQTFDAPNRFVPALIAELAFQIAMKKAPERAQLLKAYADAQFALAGAEDHDRSTWRMIPKVR